jgi:hypothetical protein
MLAGPALPARAWPGTIPARPLAIRRDAAMGAAFTFGRLGCQWGQPPDLRGGPQLCELGWKRSSMALASSVEPKGLVRKRKRPGSHPSVPDVL